MLKRQESKYIDKQLTDVFYVLELHSSHNLLIGSQRIRNLLYSNDFDLNSSVDITDSIAVLNSIYNEFLQMFVTAKENPRYYIIDFKCGIHNGDPIRWTYSEMIQGYIKLGNITYSFQECLLMDENLIKLDICYLYNNIFTDVNCVYNLHILKQKDDLKKSKIQIKSEVVKKFRKEIKELEKNGQYFKAIKRHFNLALLNKKFDVKIIGILNSDYGMMYKFISFLNLVVEVIDQSFKPVSTKLVKINLEYIKMFASKITTIEIDDELDELVYIIVNVSNKITIRNKLIKLSNKCAMKLDLLVSKLIE